MTENDLIELLKKVSDQKISIEEAFDKLLMGPFKTSQLEEATIDYHRSLRHSLGEVVYGEGKSIEQLLAIFDEYSVHKKPVLCTRLSKEKLDALKERFPEGNANYLSKMFIFNQKEAKHMDSNEPFIAIAVAGTSDLYVAHEAIEVCRAMEVAYELIIDIGITGLHRVINKLPILKKASVLIVIAGMEGALASVLAGLVGRPIIAVPTSVGFGTHLNGIVPLLSMLNSCAPGLVVVNVDGGFSAGYAACQIINSIKRALALHKI